MASEYNIVIKEHLSSIRELEANIADMEKTISKLPRNKLRFGLEVQLRILKRAAENYRDNSEELYDQVLDFAMKVAS